MLYLHIPFCEKRCGYCAFNTFADKNGLIKNYINALLIQLEYELQKNNTDKLQSIYFGGGTPSLLDVDDFERIFDKLGRHIAKDTEVTVEVNPSSWNTTKAKALFAMGANRLSIGIQSLNDEKLKFLSRTHNAKGALSAYKVSVDAGFANISVDFMYDTKFDSENFLEKELSEFLRLDATHISAYSLTIEENTPFARSGVKSRYDANAAALVAGRLVEAGYEHYEVASFGRKRSSHNLGYWEYKPYMGIGAGAVGCNGNTRYYPQSNLEKYIKNPLLIEMENLTAEEIRMEKILLGLRSKVGVELGLLRNKQTALDLLIQNGLIKIESEILYSTDFFIADELAARLS